MADELFKRPIVYVQSMYVTGPAGEIADRLTMNKMNQIFIRAIDTIRELVKKHDSKTEHSQLKYESVQLVKESERKPDGVKFVVFVEDIEDSSEIEASADGYRAEIHIPKKKVDELPNETVIEKWSDSEKFNFECVLYYVLHEMIHLFGAFHSNFCLMSGFIPLFDEDCHIDLDYLLDNVSTRIVCETLNSTVLRQPPFATFVFNKNDRSLRIESKVGISTVVFLKETYYTTSFYFTSELNFQCIAPDDSEWDSLFVQFAYGGSFLNSKRNIYNNIQYNALQCL